MNNNLITAKLPTLEIGDSWERTNNRIFEVIDITDTHYRLQVAKSNGDGKPYIQYWSKISLGQDLDESNGKITTFFDPALELFRFPLKIGLIWCFKYRSPTEGPVAIFERCNEVKAVEEVSVKAGKFLSFRVNSLITSLDRARSANHVYWYAPEVRGIIKSINDLADLRVHDRWEFELVKFTPGSTKKAK